MADASDAAMVAVGIAPDPASLHTAWLSEVRAVLDEATLTLPTSAYGHKGGKRGVHSEHLGFILADMQFLQRAYPGAVW